LGSRGRKISITVLISSILIVVATSFSILTVSAQNDTENVDLTQSIVKEKLVIDDDVYQTTLKPITDAVSSTDTLSAAKIIKRTLEDGVSSDDFLRK